MNSAAGHIPPTFRKVLVADLNASNIPVAENVGIVRLVKHTLFGLYTRHNFACVFHLRLNHMIGRRFPRIAALYEVWRYYTFGNDISHRAEIGLGLRLHHTSDIVIGRLVRMGTNCHVYNGVTIGSKSMDRHEMPSLGNNVLIGTGAKVLGDITIGDNAVVGALTFCDKNVPDNTVAVGNPMRFLDK